MSIMDVRDERPGDEEAIREVNLAAFGGPQEARIVDELRESCDDLLSLVAVAGSRVVGHVLFSPVVVESERGVVHGMGLAPVAVAPERQRQGIGSRLIREGIERLRARGCPFVVVLGHADYYPRFGFVPASRLSVRCQWDVPDEAFQILVLDGRAMGGVAGVARYPEEFSVS